MAMLQINALAGLFPDGGIERLAKHGFVSRNGDYIEADEVLTLHAKLKTLFAETAKPNELAELLGIPYNAVASMFHQGDIPVMEALRTLAGCVVNSLPASDDDEGQVVRVSNTQGLFR